MISIVTDYDSWCHQYTVNCPHSPRAALRLIGDADMPTVLIVDDYPAVRKTLRKLLEKLGWSCASRRSTVVTPFAKTEAASPDLIILDLGIRE